tara:strand:- start:2533 stop:2808 length:276 start_codon:yes stop_codon:yes gene_type:complete
MKQLIESISFTITELDEDKKQDRIHAVQVLKGLIDVVTSQWVDGEGGNFNLQLIKIIKIYSGLLTTQKWAPHNQARKEVVEIIDEFLKEVA